MPQDPRGWAQRRAGRGGGRTPDPPAPSAPVALPLPPPGYAWVQTQMGLMCLPIQGGTASPIPPAIRQPQHVVPYAHPAAPFAPGAPLPPPGYAGGPPPETCVLVKTGARDPYGELLQQLPELVPPSPYDAMAGHVNPLVARELAAMPEYHYRGDAPHPEAPPIARPAAGRGAADTRAMMPRLGEGPPAPPAAPEEPAAPAAPQAAFPPGSPPQAN
jgi:hypothetical protein